MKKDLDDLIRRRVDKISKMIHTGPGNIAGAIYEKILLRGKPGSGKRTFSQARPKMEAPSFSKAASDTSGYKGSIGPGFKAPSQEEMEEQINPGYKRKK